MSVESSRSSSDGAGTSAEAIVPPTGPNAIQLYSLATPNGEKISIMLEECRLTYDAHVVDVTTNTAQFSEWFRRLNPNSKIPAITHSTDDGRTVTVFESGAILLYLADLTGRFLAPMHTAQRYATLQWLYWQMSAVGPIFGQVNHFFLSAAADIPYAKERYLGESRRLLTVLDSQLSTNAYVSGDDYTIADMALWPWIHFYLARHRDRISDVPIQSVERWHSLISERPAVQRGLTVCKPQRETI
jgi:GST-like protein